MTFVVPRVTQLIKGRGQTLPAPTKVLITISEFLVNYWLLVLVGLLGLVVCFQLFVNSEKGGLAWDRFKLRLPVFGDLMRKQAMARFSMTLATLLRSGVPALQAMQVTKAVLDNKVLQNALQTVHDRVLEGTDIATPMKMSGAFPPTVPYMVGVGEQAGNLEEMLERIAGTYDEEVDFATQKLTSVIEPIIIVILAMIVAGIVVAIVDLAGAGGMRREPVVAVVAASRLAEPEGSGVDPREAKGLRRSSRECHAPQALSRARAPRRCAPLRSAAAPPLDSACGARRKPRMPSRGRGLAHAPLHRRRPPSARPSGGDRILLNSVPLSFPILRPSDLPGFGAVQSAATSFGFFARPTDNAAEGPRRSFLLKCPKTPGPWPWPRWTGTLHRGARLRARNEKTRRHNRLSAMHPAGTGDSGFTLVEIMVVIVILGILATIVGSNVLGQSDKARVEAAKIEIENIHDIVNQFMVQKQPHAIVEDLITPDARGHKYIEIEQPKEDPWVTSIRSAQIPSTRTSRWWPRGFHGVKEGTDDDLNNRNITRSAEKR